MAFAGFVAPLRRPRRLLLAMLLGLLPGAPAAAVWAAPSRARVLAVLGTAADGGVLDGVAAGAAVAAARAGGDGRSFRVEVFDDQGTAAGLKAALREVRSANSIGVVAAASVDLVDEYWRATRSLKVPWFFVTSTVPDATRNRGNVWHLAPSPAAQAVEAADALLAPLAARRAAILHEPTAAGRLLASAFARNLSERITLAGILEWGADADAATAGGLEAYEADWIYVAASGRHAMSFVRALGEGGVVRRCLFADGNRREDLVALAPDVLEGSVFLDAPDPELQGRLGEDLVTALEEDGTPVGTLAARAFEGARRILGAYARSGGATGRKLSVAVEEGEEIAGPLGLLPFEPHRALRFFPFTLWRVEGGRLDLWPEGSLPTPGCGPPLGFGRVEPAPVNDRHGKVGYLTYGEGETRTIEQDLLEVGLSTGGADPELDAFLREEILHRAIRIAHRLFRREADGTPIPGWSWGMSFTTEHDEERSRSDTWLAIVAGDHPAAGGQVIGDRMVAVYSTFLKRTMYVQHKLEPPVSAADRALLDGTYRWGADRTLNHRADKIRCLVDGFASAVGMTLSHEFGHLCDCGHDTEHPTSIMNVVAGAGASWEAAVWIPSHQRRVTQKLGIEGVEK